MTASERRPVQEVFMKVQWTWIAWRIPNHFFRLKSSVGGRCPCFTYWESSVIAVFCPLVFVRLPPEESYSSWKLRNSTICGRVPLCCKMSSVSVQIRGQSCRNLLPVRGGDRSTIFGKLDICGVATCFVLCVEWCCLSRTQHSVVVSIAMSQSRARELANVKIQNFGVRALRFGFRGVLALWVVSQIEQCLEQVLVQIQNP